jgi:two-component system sensor histidine kinase DctS
VTRWLSRWSSLTLSRRWGLWGLLVLLVITMLGTLVWLASRYEIGQVQEQLDRDGLDAVNDIRTALQRNVQALQALQALPAQDPSPAAWSQEAAELLRQHREWVRLEWRDAELHVLRAADSPFRAPVFARYGRSLSQPEVLSACSVARRQSGPGYSRSNYISLQEGVGQEIMEMCLPQQVNGRVVGYLVTSYSLHDMLFQMLPSALVRRQQVSFTEADGTRLAMQGSLREGSRIFSTQQLLDLPGNTLVVRVDRWHAASSLTPNLLPALVTALAIALGTVLVMLGRDMRRRQRVESDLADALAFRKAMEDSLVTGLRARDLNGRITYVNPAFCEMVGFEPHELLGHGIPAPYWPPEMFAEYGQRQALRLAGNAPPREGVESVFIRKSGERFQVLIFEAPLINAMGKQTGWMSAVLDISEQRRVEELSRASLDRLQATARLATVGEMASLLSHELNQPLAAIASYATGSLNLFETNDSTANPQELQHSLHEAMSRIARQAERAGQVIKSVHDFVRRRDHAHEAVTPRVLLDSVLPLVHLQARKLAVQVRVDCPDDMPAVLCDRTMVEQVLLNLARNAMQAMAEIPLAQQARLLSFRVKPAASNAHQQWLLFEVADVGPGISAEVSAQLFHPFFTTKPEGMGLGLSLCRTVVEQHGGYLGHRPNSPQGTVFDFTLSVAGDFSPSGRLALAANRALDPASAHDKPSPTLA